MDAEETCTAFLCFLMGLGLALGEGKCTVFSI